MEEDVVFLKERIEELEEKVEKLRFSRRVLMNMLERLEQEHSHCLLRLEKNKIKNNIRRLTF